MGHHSRQGGQSVANRVNEERRLLRRSESLALSYDIGRADKDRPGKSPTDTPTAGFGVVHFGGRRLHRLNDQLFRPFLNSPLGECGGRPGE